MTSEEGDRVELLQGTRDLEAKYDAITRAGRRALARQTERWRRLVGFVDAFLLEER